MHGKNPPVRLIEIYCLFLFNCCFRKQRAAGGRRLLSRAALAVSSLFCCHSHPRCSFSAKSGAVMMERPAGTKPVHPWLCLLVAKCRLLAALLRACGLHRSHCLYLHGFLVPASFRACWAARAPRLCGRLVDGAAPGDAICKAQVLELPAGWGRVQGVPPFLREVGQIPAPSAKKGFAATAACEAELTLSSARGSVRLGGLETYFCGGKALVGTVHLRQNVVVSALTSLEAGKGSPESCFCCSLWDRKQYLC